MPLLHHFIYTLYS